MPDPMRIAEMRKTLLEHLEAALAIADEIKSSAAGMLIETALDQVRAETWPGNLDLLPMGKR
jgi:hypothetical protein